MSDLNQDQIEKKLRQLDQRDKTLRIFEVVVLGLVIVLTLFSLNQVNKIATNNEKNIIEHAQQVDNVTSNNRARIDVILCIISVSPTTRTPEYVKNCYEQIEKEYNIKVQRFGNGIE